MNYGWEDTEDWLPEEKDLLATTLKMLCLNYTDRFGMQPYVEVGGLYAGVRIRRITHLTPAQEEELVAAADVAYSEVKAARGSRTTYGTGKSGHWSQN